MRLLATLTFLLLPGAAAAGAEVVVIRSATLVDVRTGTTRADTAIIVKGTRIVAVEQGGTEPTPLGANVIDGLDKVVWGPPEVEGLAPGAEIAVLRGDLAKDHSESVVRLPAGYFLRSHTHTSDELYIWISGAFTLIAHDGTETKFRGPAYISYPGNAPVHGIRCGENESCLFYLRYSRPFDIKY